MKGKLPTGVAVAIIAVLVLVVGFLLVRTYKGSGPATLGELSAADKAKMIETARNAMTHSHGDPSQMSPDEKAAYEEALKRGLITNPYMAMRMGGPPGSGAGGGQPPAGYPPSNMSGPPRGYPNSNMGGAPGAPAGYPNSNMGSPGGPR